MKKLLMSVLCLFTLSACHTDDFHNREILHETEPVESEKYEAANMSEYEEFKNEDGVFYDITVDDFVKRYNDGENFVTIFSFAKCPWCNDALPVLNAVAKKHNMQVAYINTRPDKSVSKNTEMPDFDKVYSILGDIIEKDNEGKPLMYVPFVVGLKDSHIAGYHVSTVDGYNPGERNMNEQEKEQLTELYETIFASVLN